MMLLNNKGEQKLSECVPVWITKKRSYVHNFTPAGSNTFVTIFSCRVKYLFQMFKIGIKKQGSMVQCSLMINMLGISGNFFSRKQQIIFFSSFGRNV